MQSAFCRPDKWRYVMPDVSKLLNTVKGNEQVKQAAEKAVDTAKTEVEKKVGENQVVDTVAEQAKKKINEAL